MVAKPYVLVYLTILCRVGSETFVPQVKELLCVYRQTFEAALFLEEEEYLKEKQLSLRCLLVMDNATVHPHDLDDDLTDWFDFIKV